MKVIAIKDGFREGRRIRKDQVFDVPEGVTGGWFKPKVETKAEAKAGAKAGAKDDKKSHGPSTFSEIAKKDGKDVSVKGVDDLV